MKKSLATIVLTLILSIGWAQNSNLDYKSAVKIYNLTTFEELITSKKLNDTSSFRNQFTNTSLQIVHPTIAFQWRSRKNNFHELELTNLMIGKLRSKTEVINDTTGNGETIGGDELSTSLISVRYEYIVNFNKLKERKLVPSIGLAVNPYYRQIDFSPVISSEFPNSETSFGMKAFITPRLTYFMTSKLFLDINVPLCFFDTFYLNNKDESPTIPIPERSISSFNFNLIPRLFSARIGVGLKL